MPVNIGKVRGSPEAEHTARVNEGLAFVLRAQGRTWAQIAEQLGYFLSDGRPNDASAYKAYKRGLKRIPTAAIEEMRLTILEQQMAILAGLLPKAQKGHPGAAMAADRIHQTQITLFGLAIPPAGPTPTFTGRRIVIVEADEELPLLAAPMPTVEIEAAE